MIMKMGVFVMLGLSLFVGCLGNSVAQDSEKKGITQRVKVPLELMQKAKEKGLVSVIVDLDKAFTFDVASAQNMLEAELAGTTYRVLGRLANVPTISLEVGSDALLVLENSKYVVKVTENRRSSLH